MDRKFRSRSIRQMARDMFEAKGSHHILIFFSRDANACLPLIVLFSASGPRSVLSGIEAEKLVG